MTTHKPGRAAPAVGLRFETDDDELACNTATKAYTHAYLVALAHVLLRNPKPWLKRGNILVSV